MEFLKSMNKCQKYLSEFGLISFLLVYKLIKDKDICTVCGKAQRIESRGK